MAIEPQELDGHRVLYDTVKECLYDTWGDDAERRWAQYMRAMAAGDTFRQTLTHDFLGGSIDAISYIDPVDGGRRHAVVTAIEEGSDYFVVDFADRATAESEYERVVHHNEDEDFPYSACDIGDIVIDSSSAMPDKLIRLPDGAVMDSDDYRELYGIDAHLDLYRTSAQIEFPTTPTLPRERRIRGMTGRPRNWGPECAEIIDATPAPWRRTDPSSRPRSVTLLDLSDGTLLMASSDDGGAAVWSTWDGSLRHLMVGHSERVFAIALFSLPAEEAVLATGGQDGLVRIWAVSDGRSLLEFQPHQRPINAVAWAAPPGCTPRLVTGGDDAVVTVWNPNNAGKVAEWTIGVPGVDVVYSLAAAVLANGHLCVAAGVDGIDSGAVHVWDVTTREKLHMFAFEHDKFGSAAPSVGIEVLVDGSFRIGAASGPVARIWDGATGTEIRAFPTPGGRIVQLAMAVLPDLRVAVAVTDGERTTVWDSESGRELASITGDKQTYPVTLSMTTTVNDNLVIAMSDADHVPARLIRLEF
jgi:WD40 repeat protein